jgi:hypothetical protein
LTLEHARANVVQKRDNTFIFEPSELETRILSDALVAAFIRALQMPLRQRSCQPDWVLGTPKHEPCIAGDHVIEMFARSISRSEREEQNS